MRKYLNTLLAASCCLLLTTQAYGSEERKEGERRPAGTRPAIEATAEVKSLDVEEQEESTAIVQGIHFELDQERVQADCDDSKGCELKLKSMVAKEVYLTTHQGVYHVPVAFTYNADTVEFEDGSCWSIDPDDRYKIFKWLSSDAVFVTQNPSWFSLYNYQIINQQTGDHCRANLSVTPYYNGYYTYWITFVDAAARTIFLNDGSVWQIASSDSMANYWVNDTVILGVNVHAGKYPNLFINAETGKYIRARCVN